VRTERERPVALTQLLAQALPQGIHLGILPGHVHNANRIGLQYGMRPDPYKPEHYTIAPKDIASKILILKQQGSIGFPKTRDGVFFLLRQEVANATSVGMEELATVTGEITNKYFDASSGLVKPEDLETLDLYISLTRNALSQVVAASTVFDLLYNGMDVNGQLIKLDPQDFEFDKPESDSRWLRDKLPETDAIENLARAITTADNTRKTIISTQPTITMPAFRRGQKHPMLQDIEPQVKKIIEGGHTTS